MTRFERLFVWLGGALFVLSLVTCGASYLIRWGRPAPLALERNLVFDAGLLTVFATHHTVFARDRVKDRVRALVPARLERSVYVWIASLLLVAVCVLWRPIGGQ